MDASAKLEKLKKHIESLGSAVVAFSGGVDSSFLLKVAFDVLGNNVLAVTAKSATFPEREYNEAVEFINKYGIRHLTIASEELELEGFAQNSTNRCYICKHELFSKINDIAKKENLKYVFEGSNHDDLSDFRPGLKAVEELLVVSPLREAELTKDDIRFLSKEMGLSTWDKPSFACLSSRFPYGQTITREKLQMVDKAEQFLIDLGFRQVRVRHHGELARIELSPNEIEQVFRKNLANNIYAYFKELGFTYTSLDLKGYRTGSMNETL
ncbi:ATP-dependent sacrificial sulfur transferase LarE [Acetivibrio cellulolyticus]|uniref:ATP-dependent sacrificial sulfur transferase LarE n=1 Tax=Acetivibrio cellulolyticus TaxID=35830 RepID=UPI0001E2F07A|nr:ATP-dependent sacrificial sulfur transferase LarE [Acetivibrio cellulolyticus]